MTTQNARTIAIKMIDAGAAPVATFVAAAGRDFGHVEAYEIPDAGYVVVYGDSGETNYEITDSVDNLPAWLESPDLDALDSEIQIANIYGLENVSMAAHDDDGPFNILRTREFGSVERTSVVRDDKGKPIEFLAYREALDWIRQAERDTGENIIITIIETDPFKPPIRPRMS